MLHPPRTIKRIENSGECVAKPSVKRTPCFVKRGDGPIQDGREVKHFTQPLQSPLLRPQSARVDTGREERRNEKEAQEGMAMHFLGFFAFWGCLVHLN